GRLIYENPEPSPTSPWLALFTRRERHTVWRNLKITGTPQVPREVPLISGDFMTGWVANFYGESQPPRLKKDKPKPEEEDQQVRRGMPQPPPPPQSPEDYDWHAKDGILIGKRLEGLTPPDPVQSRLYYNRPLREGET